MGSKDHRRRRNFNNNGNPNRRPPNPNSYDYPASSGTPVASWSQDEGSSEPTYTAPGSDEPMMRPRRRGGEGYSGGEDRNRDTGRSMRDMFFRSKAQVTLVILTHQAEPYLENLLHLIKSQESPYQTEILVLDDNSTDRTPLILRSRGIRNYPITARRGIRETACRLAEGEVLVFLTQDTLPLDRQWLRRLVAPILEKRPVGLVHGRLMADTAVPPYQRALIQARPYVSGSKMLYFSGWQSGPGSDLIPHTNVAISQALLTQAGQRADDDLALLDMMYASGNGKLYLPSPVAAVRRGELPKRFLAPQAPENAKSLSRQLSCHGAHLLAELREIGEAGELPSGERGEAYAVAIAIRTAQAASLVASRYPKLIKTAARISPKLNSLWRRRKDD